MSGTGKSTLGSALSKVLGMPFIDGDDLHPVSNVAKMAAGQPLTDLDREPWLRLIRRTGEEKAAAEQERCRNENDSDKENSRPGVVVACSALKRYYRDILRGSQSGEDSQVGLLPTYFVFIDGSKEVLMDRMQKRTGHFMKASMLESQLETLENPAGEEGVVVVSVENSTQVQVEKAVESLHKMFDSIDNKH